MIKKIVKSASYVSESSLDGTEEEGLITAHFGAMVLLENLQGQEYQCHLRKNMEPCTTGDRVLWRKMKDQTGVVIKVLPRHSLLSRPDKKRKLIAANIDAIFIVVAAPPLFSLYLLDCYLIAAEHLKIKPVIVINKADLFTAEERADIQLTLKIYEKIGYSIIFSSIYLPNGLKALNDALAQKTAVLVGASGVGKSSIISALAKNESIIIGENTEHSGLGRHTTTATHLYHLPSGGNLIDSPGVREFSLWQLNPEEILQGFVEFLPYIAQCRFRNCQHMKEPGCAIHVAIQENLISASRFKSYCELLGVEAPNT